MGGKEGSVCPGGNPLVMPTSQRAQAHTCGQTELAVSPVASNGTHTMGSCGTRLREVGGLIREPGSIFGDVGVCFGSGAVGKWAH